MSMSSRLKVGCSRSSRSNSRLKSAICTSSSDGRVVVKSGRDIS